MMGTKVCQLSHGNWEPPQVMGIKTLVELAVKSTIPVQSNRVSLLLKLGTSAVSLTLNGTTTRPIAQKGKLM